MPDFLQQKPDAIAIGNVCLGDPLQDARIVVSRALADLIAADGKLAAAETADAQRGVVAGHIEQLCVDLGEYVVQVEIVEVVRGGMQRVPCVRAEGRRRAAQI